MLEQPQGLCGPAGDLLGAPQLLALALAPAWAQVTVPPSSVAAAGP
jgi:hypothetical protein